MSDLALFKSHLGTAVLDPVMFSDVAVVSGVKLLSQRFVTLLLREYDAVFSRGTQLMAQLRGGVLSGASTKLLVNLAVAQAVQQMPKGETPEETLSSVSVASVVKDRDRLTISLVITAQSAQTTTTTTTVRTT